MPQVAKVQYRANLGHCRKDWDMAKNAPCKGCIMRKPKCHSTCELYKKWLEELERLKGLAKKEEQIAYLFKYKK